MYAASVVSDDDGDAVPSACTIAAASDTSASDDDLECHAAAAAAATSDNDSCAAADSRSPSPQPKKARHDEPASSTGLLHFTEIQRLTIMQIWVCYLHRGLKIVFIIYS